MPTRTSAVGATLARGVLEKLSSLGHGNLSKLNFRDTRSWSFERNFLRSAMPTRTSAVGAALARGVLHPIDVNFDCGELFKG